MKNRNKDLIQKKIIEKDKAKEEYDKMIGNIKSKKGINFSIDYLKNNNINTIMFSNLKYKNKSTNINIYYSGEYHTFNAITYELNKNNSKKNLDEEMFIETIEKEYKLNLVVEEIENANSNYRKKLLMIDKKYSEKDQEQFLSDDELELRKLSNNT